MANGLLFIKIIEYIMKIVAVNCYDFCLYNVLNLYLIILKHNKTLDLQGLISLWSESHTSYELYSLSVFIIY